MKAVISHVYSFDNKGDAAILSAQISELRNVFPGIELVILTIDKITKNELFEGVPVINALMYYPVSSELPKSLKAFQAMYMMCTTILWAILYRLIKIKLPINRSYREVLDILLECSLDIGVGGGYLRSKKGMTSSLLLLLLFHQFILTKILGKPNYLYAQSIGPFPGAFQESIARVGLRTIKLATLREQKSLNYFKRLSPNTPVYITGDSAFLLTDDSNEIALSKYHIPQESKVIGITAREWLNRAKQEQYERELGQFILWLLKHGYYVMAIPQVTSVHHGDDDRIVARRIADVIGRPKNFVVLEENLDHRQLKSLYAKLYCLVGTRFHSVIFALSSEVPAIAIEYEHKTSGILADLDLSEWCIPIDQVKHQLLEELFIKLQANYLNYAEKLPGTIVRYKVTCKQSAKIIKADYSLLKA